MKKHGGSADAVAEISSQVNRAVPPDVAALKAFAQIPAGGCRPAAATAVDEWESF